MSNKIRVTVWNEAGEPQKAPDVVKVYPAGLHNAIADFLNKDAAIEAKTAVLQDDGQGLTEEILANTDVLVYWAHCFHDKVDDRAAKRVVEHAQRGMGVIFLHSAHLSKPFTWLLGTTGTLSWREAGEKCRLWTAAPSHPIASGIPTHFDLAQEEMYSEPFGIPEPANTVFISWYEGGNVFRSGVTFERNNGRIFYFQPGHETHPTYHDATIQKVIVNAVKWAAPRIRQKEAFTCPNDKEPLEKIG